MITFRLGLFQMDEKRARDLVEAIKRQKGCCDTVWLTTMGYYPSLERHRGYVEGWTRVMDIFREAGIRVSMQIANTLGHGDHKEAAPAFGGEFGKGMAHATDDPYMVGPQGQKNISCFCWNSESIRDYFRSVVKLYCASIRPYRLFFDDDLRAHNHTPSRYGCYCDRCISKFNQRHGSSFTREELVHEINYGDPAWRKKYIEFCKQGIYEFTYEIARAAREVHPDITFGWENEHWTNYMGPDDSHVLQALYDAGDGKPVELRPGGGFYNDKNPWEQYIKAMDLAGANSVLPPYVQAMIAECENLPGTAYGKSIGGIINEGTIDLAMGCNELSFTDVQSCHEDMSYYEKIFAKMAEARPYWQRLSEVSTKHVRGGVGIYMGEQPHLRKTSEEEKPFAWIEFLKEREVNWLKMGLPLTYDRRGPAAYVLHHTQVKSLTDDDIRFLLTKPVAADGSAVWQLCQRGFGSYFHLTPEAVGNDTMEIFTDHPVNCGKVGRFYNENPHAAVPMQRYVFRDLDQSSEVIGEMYYGHFLTDESFIGPCSLITQIHDPSAAEPVRWLISGYSLWNDLMSSGKRHQVASALDAITTMPATLLSEEQCVMIPSVDREGRTVSVTLSAASQNGTGELELIVRRPAGLKVDAMATRHQTVPVRVTQRGEDELLVTVGALDPYEIATVFFA